MSRNVVPPGIFGHDRTKVTPHYAVMPPEGILPSRLPGFEGCEIRFHTSPAMGACFAQALLILEPGGGTAAPREDALEHFFFVVEGGVALAIGGRSEHLVAGGFGYVPAGARYSLRNEAEATCRLIWIKRPFEAVPGLASPPVLFGRQEAVPRVNKHTDGRAWQALLGERRMEMDMEVNILSFAPGTHFPFVETHIMEHGLFMLGGQGLYLLGGDWHECWAGDFVWMGPYVPQQFYATGWGEASYLLYKNVNRDVVFSDR